MRAERRGVGGGGARWWQERTGAEGRSWVKWGRGGRHGAGGMQPACWLLARAGAGAAAAARRGAARWLARGPQGAVRRGGQCGRHVSHVSQAVLHAKPAARRRRQPLCLVEVSVRRPKLGMPGPAPLHCPRGAGTRAALGCRARRASCSALADQHALAWRTPAGPQPAAPVVRVDQHQPVPRTRHSKCSRVGPPRLRAWRVCACASPPSAGGPRTRVRISVCVSGSRPRLRSAAQRGAACSPSNAGGRASQLAS